MSKTNNSQCEAVIEESGKVFRCTLSTSHKDSPHVDEENEVVWMEDQNEPI